MDEYATVTKHVSVIEEKPEEHLEENELQEHKEFIPKDAEFNRINQLYDECLNYLKQENVNNVPESIEPDYVSIEDYSEQNDAINEENTGDNDHENNDSHLNDVKELEDHDIKANSISNDENKMIYKIENELISSESIDTVTSEPRSERLRKLSQQLPKIIITQTQSNTSLNIRRHEDNFNDYSLKKNDIKKAEHKSLPKINPRFKEHEFKSNNLKDGPKQSRRMEEEKLIGNGKKKPYKDSSYGPAEVDDNVNSKKKTTIQSSKPPGPLRPGQPDLCKRLVSKRGVENVAVISNVPFERIRLLNDTFHTLINLRWRWIVTGTIVVHFAIWLVFAVFWYIVARAHYDFEPDPPPRTCVTGGHDFLTIFLASVEAQTTIGFGDRAIDEECPESIFLFIMQLILGTGLSGVLTCVVYAKLTRPEKLSRDGVGFSKKAVISSRDGQLCLMLRAWDLNHDHIIGSEFTAHFVHTHRTKEGEVIRYYAHTLTLRQRQFLLWPVTLLHVIDRTSPLYGYTPDMVNNTNYEITISLKGASASMGTFTQSQTSYLPREVLWGHRFPPVVKYDSRKQKYVIDHAKLDATEPVDTPLCSARELASGSTITSTTDKPEMTPCPGTPSSFSDRISSFHLERSSSFRKNAKAS